METDHQDKVKHQELTEEIRRMLTADTNSTRQKLDLIDAIQRLGVSYHFEREVGNILEEMYKAQNECDLRDNENDDGLYYISLHFRLLREHGYKISSDVFSKYKDNDGNFKASIVEDVRGMLSLYEAGHLRVHGENILDDALAFTTSHLESVDTQLISSQLAAQIKHALKQPIRKGIQRLEARHYMSIYQEDPSHNDMLLTFAKLDFNILQKLHQRELSEISRWWKDLDFAHKLPFARDRVVECYFWILAAYFESNYYFVRRILTKVISMTSIIDDIYDVYGTIEELELFTTAVERWNISSINQLPEYMKLCYGALLDVYSETEKILANQGNLCRLNYAQEAMKIIVKNYFYEAQWCHKKYVPTMEEYMTVALLTSGYPMSVTTSFVCMEDTVTKEAFEWLFSNPKMLKAAAVICRLMDDIASHKSEQSRGHVASSIECYMKQYGATEEEACNEFQKQVSNAWKDINEECLRPTFMPMPLLTRILNFARAIDVIYKDDDGYTHAEVVLKDFIASLLIKPVPL